MGRGWLCLWAGGNHKVEEAGPSASTRPDLTAAETEAQREAPGKPVWTPAFGLPDGCAFCSWCISAVSRVGKVEKGSDFYWAAALGHFSEWKEMVTLTRSLI